MCVTVVAPPANPAAVERSLEMASPKASRQAYSAPRPRIVVRHTPKQARSEAPRVKEPFPCAACRNWLRFMGRGD